VDGAGRDSGPPGQEEKRKLLLKKCRSREFPLWRPFFTQKRGERKREILARCPSPEGTFRPPSSGGGAGRKDSLRFRGGGKKRQKSGFFFGVPRGAFEGGFGRGGGRGRSWKKPLSSEEVLLSPRRNGTSRPRPEREGADSVGRRSPLLPLLFQCQEKLED